jgi:hypothetical protein
LHCYEQKCCFRISCHFAKHDYGLNDADGSLPFKEASREVFLEFAREPKDSPRWTRNGIYASYSFDNGRVKVLCLIEDNEFFLSSLYLKWEDCVA